MFFRLVVAVNELFKINHVLFLVLVIVFMVTGMANASIYIHTYVMYI